MADPVQNGVVPSGSVTTTIPLGNRAYSTALYSLGIEKCENMYLENAQSDNSKAQYYLLKIPGLKRFSSIPTTNQGACRLMFTSSTYRTFSVNGQFLFEVNPDGSTTQIGMFNSLSGPVYAADNGFLLMFVDGKDGWILRLADSNWTKITDEYFPGNGNGTLSPTFVTFLDERFIVNNPDSNQYYYSTPNYGSDHDNTTDPYPVSPVNPSTQPNGYWSPLNSGAKIAQADNINAVVACNNYLWLFGYNSCEIHYDTGNYNGQLFARYQGAILNVGCQAPNSVAQYQDNIFFLGSDIKGTLGVFSNDGMSPVRVSTRGIEQIIESMGTWTDCQAYTYSQLGHSFYVMLFPTANRTLVYDTVTNSWHERTKLIKATGLLSRWDGMYATNNYNKLIIGDASTSCIYELDPEYYQKVECLLELEKDS